jgi:hypothetical protein
VPVFLKDFSLGVKNQGIRMFPAATQILLKIITLKACKKVLP